ncbi:MAG TPA: hypothetical protein VLY87_05595, partial [Flavobacterium sp.]|nr:hypothetical protein [Flavobacterium sp.]
KSTEFYTKILRKKPGLNVPGMTEFHLNEYVKLGLMPNNGIAKILQQHTPHPESGNGIPRCELYLSVDDLIFEFNNAIQANALLISEIQDRDWGDRVCYFADLDGHIIAFAEKTLKK